jgi:hypothetical protein
MDLLTKLPDFKTVYVLHFLFNYLVILKNLSFSFIEQLFLSTTEPHVKNTMASTESLANMKRDLLPTLS